MSTKHHIETVRLNDGTSIPLLGLGTYQAAPGITKNLVTSAIDIGYRHFDCADFYENETEIGDALNDAFAQQKVTRDDLYITTKVWPTWLGAGRPRLSVQRSLARLRLDYVDLLLVHWPTPFKQDDNDFYPQQNGQILLDESIDLVDVWKEFEQIKSDGLAKSIGVSNFNSKQIEQLIDSNGTVPVMNQVECHPLLSQRQLKQWCAERDIHLTAYSPLARSGTEEKKNTGSVLDNETIVDIARAHQVTAAQVCIRWQVQRGVVVIPKTSNHLRLVSNIAIDTFTLTEAEMKRIDSLDQGIRNNTWTQFGIDRHKNWPFSIPY